MLLLNTLFFFGKTWETGDVDMCFLKTCFNVRVFSGKIDVGRYPEVAESFIINTSPLTRQLPTLILFEQGKETGRVPAIISGKIVKFVFKEEDIVNVFDLNNLYIKCKEDKKFASKAKKDEAVAVKSETKKDQ